MKYRVRSCYYGAHAAMLGAVLVSALIQRNLIPTVIWLAVTALIIVFGKED